MPVMDPVVASWIKELVLRQNIPLNIAEGFLDMLPNEPADSESESSLRVRRGVPQRRLAEGLTRRLVTPYTLDTIEALYALRPLPAAVDAYRVVAIYLAASASDFPSSVSDLLVRRIPNLLRSPSAAGLASPSLHAEVRELELSVTNIKLRNWIMERNSRSKALDAMRALLEAEYQDVGPPILELFGENVVGDEDEDEDEGDAETGSQAEAEAEAEAGEDLRGDEAAESGSRAEGTATQTPAQVARQTPPPAAAQNQATQTPPAVEQNQAARTPSGEKATEMTPGGIEVLRRPKIDGSRLGKGTTPTVNEEQGNSNEAMVRDPIARYSRLGKGTISTSNEVTEQDPAARNSQLGKGTTQTSNRVIERDREALNNRLGKRTIPTTNEGGGNSSKFMERDPTARDSRLGKGTISTSNKVIEQDLAAHDSQLGKGAAPTTNEGGNSSKVMERDPTARDSGLGKSTTTMNEKEGHSTKAMEEDPTDHTYERGDGVKAKAVCPPTLVANKRRKTRRWSVLEEDTLRSAVRELGKGYWKEILRNHSDVFEGRTEVDLKDKWRNMTR